MADEILFTVGRAGGARDVLRIEASGGEAGALTSRRQRDDPSWSPDATRIAYTREQAAGIKQLFVMNADGTGERPLIDPSIEDPTCRPATPIRRGRPTGPGSRSRAIATTQGIWIVAADGGRIRPSR